jgi:hypothetical protein
MKTREVDTVFKNYFKVISKDTVCLKLHDLSIFSVVDRVLLYSSG